MKFQRYKRGSLVMVDFSPSKGSELKGKHLAIVITKKDTPNNAVLTVVPLSSKEKPYYLDLGNFLLTDIAPYLRTQFDTHLQKCEEAKSILDLAKKEELAEENLNNTLKFKAVLNTYMKMNKESFALVQNITTISKLRVLKPINKYDPIKNLIVSNELLDKIDDKITELFTAK